MSSTSASISRADDSTADVSVAGSLTARKREASAGDAASMPQRRPPLRWGVDLVGISDRDKISGAFELWPWPRAWPTSMSKNLFGSDCIGVDDVVASDLVSVMTSCARVLRWFSGRKGTSSLTTFTSSRASPFFWCARTTRSAHWKNCGSAGGDGLWRFRRLSRVRIDFNCAVSTRFSS